MSAFVKHCRLLPNDRLRDFSDWLLATSAQESASLRILPIFAKTARGLVAETGTSISVVAGYPYGHTAIEAKLAETVLALVDGVPEIVLYVNSTALVNNDWQLLAGELNTIAGVTSSKGCRLVVRLDAQLLNHDLLQKVCDLYGIAGIHALWLDGVAAQPEGIEQIRLARSFLADAVQLEVSSHQNSITSAKKMLEAGAEMLVLTDGLLIAASLQTSPN